MKVKSSFFAFIFLAFIVVSFKGKDNNANYELSKENSDVVLTATFNSSEIHDALLNSKNCIEGTKVTMCIDSYLKENIEIMADSAIAKLSFMSSSTVNNKLTIKYRLSRIPADFNQLIIKNTIMNGVDDDFKNIMTIQLGKKAKEIVLTSKKSVIELAL